MRHQTLRPIFPQLIFSQLRGLVGFAASESPPLWVGSQPSTHSRGWDCGVVIKSDSTLQQFPCMTASAGSDFRTSQHACEFLHLCLPIQLIHADSSLPADHVLVDKQMTVRKSRDLRLVSDAQHLISLRQLLKLYTDSFTDAT